MKKTLSIISSIVLICVIALLIPKNTKPPNDTRVILDHTYRTHIAPPCFEQSEATNNLEETHLGDAVEMDFKPHDTCTEDALQEQKDSLLISTLKSIGFIQTKWDEW